MQIKGAIRLVAILLTLICIYYLSFTVVTASVENDAEEYAQGDLNKKQAYLDSMANEEVYNFLGFRQYTLRECRQREINLGLDLKGGMNVILEVQVDDIIRSLSNNSQDTVFKQALQRANELQRQTQEDYITLFGRAFEEIAPNARLAAIFNTYELRDQIDYNSSNEEVLDVLREETQDALDNTFNILRTRIDRFGVVQPNIQKLENTGRILVELPGVKDQERVKDLLQTTASLEFQEVYENPQVYEYMEKANQKISQVTQAREKLQQDTTTEESVEEIMAQSSQEGDEEEVSAQDTTGEESLLDQIEEQDTSQLDTSATQEQMAQQYPLFQVLQPMVNPRNNQLMQGSVVGVAHFTDTAQVNDYLQMPQVQSVFPRDMEFHWGVKPYQGAESGEYYPLYALKLTGREGQAPLSGEAVTNARAEFGRDQATAEVTMSMNSEGAKTWARMTKNNVNEHIAIVLDNLVYSAPRVQQEIKGGRSQITGDFTVQEAKDLANVLKSGKLPARAQIIQSQTIGPSLGQESINAGLTSFFIAFIVVMLYMVFYYSRKAGLVSDIALLANMFFIFGVLASLGAVLTLPGIAGIILTIGMSVDANVLIYDRIREELRAGKGIKLAVKDGYKNAYSAIIDANVTTFLTALILYIFGTGPIKGFATTLLIGILTSLFTAIFITRLIFERYLEKNKPITFATKLTEGAFRNANFPFLSRRKILYAVSSVLILISLVSLATRGLNEGVDFTGGRAYIVRFDHPVNSVEIQNRLGDELGQPPQVKIFGDDNQIKLTTQYKIDQEGKEVDEEVVQKIYAGLQPFMEGETSMEEFTDNYIQSELKVGPTVAYDIRVQAVWAIVFALLITFLYIFGRFRNWQYGLGALTALIHDVIIILGIFSLFYNIMPFSMEVDQAFIAAILTVVGYSINDTVVVFDRVREYIGLYPKRDRFSIINRALNSTLSRTFSTSLSTFVVLLTIFLFGGEVIRGFVFALLVGVIVGTYSSLFIASPVVYDTVHKKVKTPPQKGKQKGKQQVKQPQKGKQQPSKQPQKAGKKNSAKNKK
ncbi:MAG: protein translocase subunit SecDF [Bacteroidales bacterium]|nr:protein translocase subunit SecDF [Bacteroidales bacterium]